MEDKIFYDYDKLVSYGATVSMLCGGRGIGKSYGAKKWVIRDFLKRGNQFVYIRRYKEEMKEATAEFFSDVCAEFPDHEFSYKGKKFYIDGEVMGFSVVLTTSAIVKSKPFPNVKTVIFDEFQIEKGSLYRYLSNEVIAFLELLESIMRTRNVRVWMISNNMSTSNPYFLYWNINMPKDCEFKRFHDGDILVQNIKSSEKFLEMKEKSPIGRLVKGTKYGDYNLENKALNDSKSFIKKKSGNCVLYFVFVLKNRTFGVWLDDDCYMFISQDYDPNYPLKVAFNPDDHDEGTILQSKISPYIKNIIAHFNDAHLCFENQEIKNILMDFLARCIRF